MITTHIHTERMRLSNFIYFWYSLIHLPASLSLMIKPKFITTYLFDVPIEWMNDYLNFLLMDITRIVGCYLFFFVCFTFFMITVNDRRTRNAFHLAMCLKCLALSLVLLFITFFNDHRWIKLIKWFLLLYYVSGFALFTFLWLFERKHPITATKAANAATVAMSSAVKAATSFSSPVSTSPSPPPAMSSSGGMWSGPSDTMSNRARPASADEYARYSGGWQPTPRQRYSPPMAPAQQQAPSSTAYGGSNFNMMQTTTTTTMTTDSTAPGLIRRRVV